MIRNLLDRMKLPFRKNKEFVRALYDILGFYPHDVSLYRVAFSHRSLARRSEPVTGKDGKRRFRKVPREESEETKPLNNERLEYLGDAVLETVVSDILFRRFQTKREGFLTSTRSKIVQREALNRLADDMGLDKLILAAHGTKIGHTNIGGNAFEALMGAIYLDRGFHHCHWFIANRVIGRYVDVENVAQKEVNFKSKLLEWSQKNRIQIDFRDKAGERGDRGFSTAILLEKIVIGHGTGRAKKDSQQQAAKDALTRMRRDPKLYESIFSAKEKRTAMEAEESFALPKIDEIEQQLADKQPRRKERPGKAPVLEPEKADTKNDPEAAFAMAYDAEADFEVIDTVEEAPLPTAEDFERLGLPAPPSEDDLHTEEEEARNRRNRRSRREDKTEKAENEPKTAQTERKEKSEKPKKAQKAEKGEKAVTAEKAEKAEKADREPRRRREKAAKPRAEKALTEEKPAIAVLPVDETPAAAEVTETPAETPAAEIFSAQEGEISTPQQTETPAETVQPEVAADEQPAATVETPTFLPEELAVVEEPDEASVETPAASVEEIFSLEAESETEAGVDENITEYPAVEQRTETETVDEPAVANAETEVTEAETEATEEETEVAEEMTEAETEDEEEETEDTEDEESPADRSDRPSFTEPQARPMLRHLSIDDVIFDSEHPLVAEEEEDEAADERPKSRSRRRRRRPAAKNAQDTERSSEGEEGRKAESPRRQRQQRTENAETGETSETEVKPKARRHRRRRPSGEKNAPSAE